MKISIGIFFFKSSHFIIIHYTNYCQLDYCKIKQWKITSLNSSRFNSLSKCLPLKKWRYYVFEWLHNCSSWSSLLLFRIYKHILRESYMLHLFQCIHCSIGQFTHTHTHTSSQFQQIILKIICWRQFVNIILMEVFENHNRSMRMLICRCLLFVLFCLCVCSWGGGGGNNDL